MKSFTAMTKAIANLKAQESFHLSEAERCRALYAEMERFVAPTGKASVFRKKAVAAKNKTKKTAKLIKKTARLIKAKKTSTQPISPAVTALLRTVKTPITPDDIISALRMQGVVLSPTPRRQMGIVLSSMARHGLITAHPGDCWMWSGPTTKDVSIDIESTSDVPGSGPVIRIVPASEIDPEKGLRAEDYVTPRTFGQDRTNDEK